MNKLVLFIHIPKTAGTSFRKAAENYFTKENTYYDYSPSSSETSAIILENIYQNQDMYALAKYFENKENIFLSGHFHAVKYASLFETLNIVTFVREPIEQVLSHYEHHCRDLGYKEDLETFVKDNRFKNIQSRILAGRPIELYGFIGLTEEYSKSIMLINDYYGLNIEVLTENISENKFLTSDALDDEMLNLIVKENSVDIELYKQAKKIFEERIRCYENKESYTHIYIQEKRSNMIRGCAFKKESDEPVEVDIFNGSYHITSLIAKDYRPGLILLGLPRKGFVGFEYIVKDVEEDSDFIVKAKIIKMEHK